MILKFETRSIAQVNGQLRMSAHAVETPKPAILEFPELVDRDGALHEPHSLPEPIHDKPIATEFVGKLGLSSFRVNQLQLAKSIEGSFTLRDDRFDLRASGSRYSLALTSVL